MDYEISKTPWGRTVLKRGDLQVYSSSKPKDVKEVMQIIEELQLKKVVIKVG